MTAPDADAVDVLTLATSIAKGEVVDWTSAGASTASPAVLDALRAIDTLGALAGRIPDTWGRVAITGELGRGSHGIVYAARDPHLGIDVALKVVRPQGLDRAASREAALDEARLLAQVNHPNVVRVFWAEASDDEVGVAMELVRGQTVAAMLERSGPMSLDQTIGLGLDVCRALGAVHAANLLHGDIKAGNVMRTSDGRTVLMDFGVGHDLKTSGSPDARWTGTPMYLAPEAFAGGLRSQQSDLYSVGVLLYHALTNSYPIEARTAADVERHHADGRPLTPLGTRRPDLPGRLVAVIDRALARHPSDRHTSAGALAAALESARSGREPVPWGWLLGSTAAVAGLALALTTTGILGSSDRDAPGAAASTPVAPNTSGAGDTERTAGSSDYRIDAALYRHEGRAEVRLAPGARVSVGDELSLRVSASVPVHAYVMNEDDRGASYLLFPLPGQQLSNPLTAGVRHELPGVVNGQTVRWTVNTVGGREHFLVVVSPEAPSPAFERLFASLPRPMLGAPMIAHPLSADEALALRGVGGLVKAPAATPGQRLSDAFGEPLPASEETTRGVWVRRLTLENPVKK